MHMRNAHAYPHVHIACASSPMDNTTHLEHLRAGRAHDPCTEGVVDTRFREAIREALAVLVGGLHMYFNGVGEVDL